MGVKDRPDYSKYLLPAAGYCGIERKYPGDQHSGTIFRTQPNFLFPEWWKGKSPHGEC